MGPAPLLLPLLPAKRLSPKSATLTFKSSSNRRLPAMQGMQSKV